MSTTTTGMEIDSLKTRLKETWMAGDYDRFSGTENKAHVFFTNNLIFPPDASCSMWPAARVRSRYGRHATE